MRLVRIMALVALKSFQRAATGVPVAARAAVDARLPVPVEHPVTLSAQKDRLVSGYLTAVVIYICPEVLAVVAVEAAHVHAVVKDHILVRAERHVECVRHIEIFLALIGRGF